MRRRTGVTVALLALLLVCFARLAAHPSALIVDADHPSVDHARHADDAPVGNDLTRLFLPHHLAIANSIAHLGHLPLWDDRGFGGRPLVGNPQAGLFYPPTWLAWWSGSPSALGWITVGHLLWAGLGTYRLGRTLGMEGWGSLVAAGCVQASPYVLAQTFEGHYPHIWSFCWYPWAFEAAVRLHRGEYRAALVIAPIVAVTFLAGHPQEGYYLLIALGGWAIWDGLVALRAGRPGDMARFWLAWAGVLVLAVGLIGIELVPDAMAQGWGLKWSRLPIRLASRYHLDALNVLQLVDPSALGGPSDYFGRENYWESVTSLGLVPLFLAVVALIWSPDRRMVRGWLILVVAAVLFAAGRKLGLFAVLYQVVPGMDRFRVPARSLFLATLGGAMLAGQGVEALRSNTADALRWKRLARWCGISATALALVVLAGRGLADRRDSARVVLDRPTLTTHDRANGLNRPAPPPELDLWLLSLSRISAEPMFWIALGGLTLGIAWASHRPGHRHGIAPALSLLGLVELGWYGFCLIATTPVDRFLGPDPISEALAKASPPGLDSPRIRAIDTLYDDLRTGRHGFTKANINDSFQIQHAADLYHLLYRLFDPDRSDRGAPMDAAVARFEHEVRQSVLDRMGISLLVADRLDPTFTNWPVLASGTWNGAFFAVYRNPSAMPRAYVVPRAEIVPEDTTTINRFREVDPQQAVLMPADPLGPIIGTRQPFTPVAWTSTDPDRVVLRVTTEAPGLLVVADTWMPGWSAEVDGHPATIWRGNRAQRVVALSEPGRHEITFRYRTPGLTLGLAMTGISTLIWAALVIVPKIVRIPAFP